MGVVGPGGGDGWAATCRAGCVVRGLRGCLLCCVVVAAGVLAEADADASLRDALARALEANERLARLAEELRRSWRAAMLSLSG